MEIKIIDGIEYVRLEEVKLDAKLRVKRVVNNLSFTEKAAVRGVLKELNSTEGTIVSSNVADKEGMTRSVIVNALRKLESAGVLITKSLGMKGTRIKVIDNLLIDVVEELDNEEW